MRRYRLLVTAGLTAVLIAGGVTVTAYALIRHDQGYARPYGIPAAVPDSQVNLMELSPVPARPAPGFTLTDQDGRILSLSAFRGQVVVLDRERYLASRRPATPRPGLPTCPRTRPPPGDGESRGSPGSS
jgi:hypothetical protein